MKKLGFVIAFVYSLQGWSQNLMPVPDTLSGTVFNLTMHQDSVQFFPGRITQTYAFNAFHFHGPTLLLRKGDPVSITVHNQIGDTTTVHWHGLHVAAKNDGGPYSMIMNNSSWNPQFTVMDRASTYWYHPHLDKKTASQAIKGAVGMIIVRDSAEATLNLPRHYGVDDFPILVQCVQFDSVNQPMPKGMVDSTLIVNGVTSPYTPLPAQVVRLRLLNGSGERTFNFGFTGNKTFYIIGSDGGLLNAPVLTTRCRLSPGERAEVLLDLTGMTGQTLYLMSYASELPMDIQGGPTMPMPPPNPPMNSPLNGINFNILQINVAPPTGNPVTSIPSSLVTVTPWLSTQANTSRTINMTAQDSMSMDGPFFFNGLSFDMMRIDYFIALNSIELWTLTNQTMVAHPFHIHDEQFYILDRDGNPPPPQERGRKDVVLVESNETVRIIAKFEDFVDTITPYMFHCHILMHEDDGMMGQFLVVPANELGIVSRTNPVGIRMYPNPAKTELAIQLQNPESEIQEVSVYDALGQLQMSIKNSVMQGDFKLNVSGLPSGAYFLRIQTPQGLAHAQFMKQAD